MYVGMWKEDGDCGNELVVRSGSMAKLKFEDLSADIKAEIVDRVILLQPNMYLL